MSIIQLDAHTAELIAAGEVVERPASVVKELVENAIDAGAAAVTVEIEGGGIAHIRVSDDGGGIEAADLPLVFVRHATSKLFTEEDLSAIHTLGFRGEAMASIASVAKVELLTKSDADADGSRIVAEGGEVGDVEAAARARGTTVTVKDLFYNTPARLKFLKRDTSEGTFVTETVTKLALGHPEVSLRYVRDGKQVFCTPGDGNLHAAIYAVLGPTFARDLLAVGDMDAAGHVVGFVTPPRAGRASRGMQYFFVNGRNVKNRTMMAALEQAFRGMLMSGKYPGGVLFLQLPPELVDVNVHPAKTEVRFAYDKDVFGVVYRAVKSALMEPDAQHSAFDFSPGHGEEPAPAQQGEAPVDAVAHVDATGRTRPETGGALGDAQRIHAANSMVREAAAGAEALHSDPSQIVYQTAAGAGPNVYYDEAADAPSDMGAAASLQAGEAGQPFTFAGNDDAAAVQTAEQQVMEEEYEYLDLRLVGEVFKTYIVAELDDTVLFIDKHAAHERLIYDRLAANDGEKPSQQLLSPVQVSLSAEEKNALCENAEALAKAGIEAEDFGGNSMLVRGVPSDVEPDDVEGLVVEVARRLSLNAKDALDEKTEWVLHSVACRAAMKAGDSSDEEELLWLAQDILFGQVPPFCPHGRPVVLEISRGELEKQFGRLG